jgi:peroxiredoxin
VNNADSTNALRSRIELGLNIAIAMAIVVVAAVTVMRYLASRHAQEHDRGNRNPPTLVGTRLSIPGLGGGRTRKNLVLFMRSDCPACKMAAPLYRELIAEASKRDVKSVAILPDSPEEGKQYLQSLQLRAQDVQSADLSAYSISAVPTALVVDGDGAVQGSWIGVKQGQEKTVANEVIALLEGGR